jgi:pyruvate carboxylase
MLKYLAETRKIVRYHDVTPGSQITWNTAFLNVTGAHKRGGEQEVRRLLRIMEVVNNVPEERLSDLERKARLTIYRDCNDAFRDLLLGKFGKLPLGWPPNWVYESAFGMEWEKAVAERSESSPLDSLPDVDLVSERAALDEALGREPSDEEFVMYLNHPGDALKTIEQKSKYGNPNNLPLDVWFEGVEKGEEVYFIGNSGKPHKFKLMDLPDPDEEGVCDVRYIYDSENLSHQVKVQEASKSGPGAVEMADSDNIMHVASPSTGDLWVMHVRPGDLVKKGEEIFNISIMKQEKAVLAPVDGVVRRVLKTANFEEDKKMVPVKGGELLVELGPPPRSCEKCGEAIPLEECKFCPNCGAKR